jgi:3' terminal RNA ribose 2'-O-methyltransferase Hen1
VLDLGCGGGALLRLLLREPSFTEIVGLDVSARALDSAERRLKLDQLPEQARARIKLRQTALTYADPSLSGYDAAVLMEVIKHVDEERLPALEHAVFSVARPCTVIVTTPNSEYNVHFGTFAAGAFRHSDHRFEWTRAPVPCVSRPRRGTERIPNAATAGRPSGSGNRAAVATSRLHHPRGALMR